MSKTTHDSESWLNQEGEWPPWGKMLERDRGHFREGLVSQESLHTPKEVGLGVPGFCLHLWISNLFGCHIQSQGHWSRSLRSHEVICVHSDKGLELRMKCSALFPSHTISQYPVRDRGGSVSMRLNEEVQTVTRRHHCQLSWQKNSDSVKMAVFDLVCTSFLLAFHKSGWQGVKSLCLHLWKSVAAKDSAIRKLRWREFPCGSAG